MKRFRVLIILFFVALALPLGYFVLRSFSSLAHEEAAELRYFAESLFDRMENELEALVNEEENRAVDEYSYYISGDQEEHGSAGKKRKRSPLSSLPQQSFILGYFQNGSDGSFQTPLADTPKDVPEPVKAVITKLSEINEAFNAKRFRVAEPEPPAMAAALKKELKKEESIAEKYFAPAEAPKQKSFLGRQEKRLEEITIAQARNIATADMEQSAIPADGITAGAEAESYAPEGLSAPSAGSSERSWLFRSSAPSNKQPPSERRPDHAADAKAPQPVKSSTPLTFQVEVAPLQSVVIDKNHFFIFRRIVLNNQILRQGFVLKIDEFLKHLAGKYFTGQPLAHFANLKLMAMDPESQATIFSAGASAEKPEFTSDRIFPRPFSFLQASLKCDTIPRSAGRTTLMIMTAVVSGTIILGLIAIYQSARVVVDLSERRAGFVSSVTHELKTPLTNIRMYVEMLEQGIAPSKERENEYFKIVTSESARLSNLINNVLEFSKLERKQRTFDMREGTFSEVIEEIKAITAEKLRQEGFTLTVEEHEPFTFAYDREVMVQVLLNLIENSMKFGRATAGKNITLGLAKAGNQAVISVSDTGPGIPEKALDRIFDDFYRVDNSLSRNTKGTGIGLALVKKFIIAMGGTVRASNNKGPGCTVTISLPAGSR